MKKLLFYIIVLCLPVMGLAQDGTLDPNFNPFITSGNALSDTAMYPIDAVQLENGKLVVLDANFKVYGLNADGTYDTGFTPLDLTTAGAGNILDIKKLIVDSQNRIYAIGSGFPFGNRDFLVFRFSTNGTLDNTYGSGGFGIYALTANEDVAYGAALDASDHLYVVGSAVGGNRDWGVIMLNPDGSYVTDFGTNGVYRLSLVTGVNEDAYCAVVDSSGLFVGGFTEQFGTRLPAIIKLDRAKGILDTGFGTGGIMIETGWGYDDNQNFRQLALTPNGKLLAAGNYGYIYAGSTTGLLNLYDINTGVKDNNFGSNGFVSFPLSTVSQLTELVISEDGQIFVSGSMAQGEGSDYDYSVDAFFTSFTPSGQSTTFNNGLVLRYGQYGERLNSSTALFLTDDNKLKSVGPATFVDNEIYAEVVQFNGDGTLDSQFNQVENFGVTLYDRNNSVDYAYDIEYVDGKILVAGGAFNGNLDWGLIRYNADGAIDSTFGTNGYAGLTLVTSVSEEAYAMDVQSNGKIVLAGYTVQDGTKPAVARFNANGSLDNTFAGGLGFVITDVVPSGQDNSYYKDVVAQEDGKIVAAGYSTGSSQTWVVTRYTSLGLLDASFGNNGVAAIEIGSTSTEVANSIVRQPDGKYVIGGTFGNQMALARLNIDGTLDHSFGDAGIVIVPFNGPFGNFGFHSINEVALQKDSKIVTVGGGTTNTILGEFLVARFNIDGTMDVSFGNNGFSLVDGGSIPGVNESLNSLVVLQSGKIVAGGQAIKQQGTVNQNALSLVRLNADGSPDTDFGVNGVADLQDVTLFDEFVKKLDVQPDGQILVGGYVNTRNYDFLTVRVNGSESKFDNQFFPSVQVDSVGVLEDQVNFYFHANPLGNPIIEADLYYSLDGGESYTGIILSDLVNQSGLDPVSSSAQINDLGTDARLIYYYFRLTNAGGELITLVNKVYYQVDIPIDNLALWLNAGTGVTVENDSLVTEVLDLSLNGLRFTNESTLPSSVILQPNGLNGEPVFRFNNENALVGDQTMDLTNGLTFFVVAKNDAKEDYNGLFRIASNVTGRESDFEIYWQGPKNSSKSGNLVTTVGRNSQGTSVAAQITNNAGPEPGNYYLLTEHISSETGLHNRYMFTEYLAPSTSVGSSDLRPLQANLPYIGIGYGGPEWPPFLTGNIAEVIIYNTGVDSSTLATVHDYLNEKYFMEPVSVNDGDGLTPTEFGLSQNYPNPFNPTTTIRFALPESAPVTLTIFNMLGQQVATLINNELMGADYHSVTFKADNLPSGMYLYRIQAGNFVSTRSMILLK